VAKVGVRFQGKTTSSSTPPEKSKETQLFSIQEILWDANPPKGKGKGVAKVQSSNDASEESQVISKRLSITGDVSHDFLFAIQWPFVNYPPSLPPNRSLVHTEYVLHAFLRLSNGEEIISEPLYADFRPQIDPAAVLKQSPQPLEKRESIVKTEEGRVLAEASLSCTDEEGITFGSHCPLTLNLLIRQSESKPLPRKARVEICEIHKSLTDGREMVFVLSTETIGLPGILKPHQEISIPLKVKIPVPDMDDTRKGATGLPTLSIGSLQVEYMIRVTVFLGSSRLSLPVRREKVVSVDCPIVIGNVKPKQPQTNRKIPRLVVNVEGEGTWDAGSTASSTASRDRGIPSKPIVEWSPDCEIPRFLADGDSGVEDIL